MEPHLTLIKYSRWMSILDTNFLFNVWCKKYLAIFIYICHSILMKLQTILYNPYNIYNSHETWFYTENKMCTDWVQRNIRLPIKDYRCLENLLKKIILTNFFHCYMYLLIWCHINFKHSSFFLLRWSYLSYMKHPVECLEERKRESKREKGKSDATECVPLKAKEGSATDLSTGWLVGL